MKHGPEVTKWHYMYFGYSRDTRRAYGFIQFEGRREEVNFPNVNHFVSKRQFLYLAKDKFYPSYNGKVANMKMLLCDGAFDP
jgi:hypothetical protein